MGIEEDNGEEGEQSEGDTERSSVELEQILESLNDPVFLHDLEGDMLYVNETAVEKLGYPEEELMDMTPMDVDTQDHAARYGERAEELRQEGTLIFESVHETRDGEKIPVEVNATVITFRGETAILSVARDITKRKKAEESLREREELYRSLIEASTDAIVSCGEDRMIRQWNEAATEIFGYSEEEVMNEKFDDYLVPERYRERHVEGFERFLETGQSRILGETVELEALRKDGTEFPVEVSISAIEIGGSYRFTAIIRDITDRKRAERALRESEEKYRNLVRWAPEAIISADEDRDITEWNEAAEEILGYSREEVMGESTDVLVPDEFLDEHIEGFENYVETGEAEKPGGYKTEALRKDGSRVPVRVSFPRKPLGLQGSVTVIVEDITERKKYEERLKEMNEELKFLNQVVRHDIRNDMNVILGWGEMLRGHVDSEGRETLNKIIDSSKHVIELTGTVRDYLETLAGEAAAELRPVGLRRYLNEEIEKKRGMYGDAVFEVEGGIPDVEVEANVLLSTLFGNLLNNAVQHNDKDVPKVEVSAEETDGSAVVSISDNGPGIPEDVKEELFGRGEKGLESEGIGVGLYLVDRLVEGYGGEIRVEDNEPEGSVFRVELRKAEPV